VTTLSSIAKRIFDLVELDAFGRSVTVTALAAQSATASSLAYGGHSDQKFAQKYIWRPDTATDADRVRYSTNWTQATGLITHTGLAYADTTVGSETMLLCTFDPFWMRRAINEIVQRVREYDETIIPLAHGQREYWLHELDWIQEPSDIQEMWYTRSPVISRNRYLQKRALNSSGVWTPDNWTVSDNADTTAFQAPGNYRGQKWYYNLERAASTNATLYQEVHTLKTGVSSDWPSGQLVTAVAVANPGNTDDIQLAIASGTSASSTGSGSALQEISASITPTAADTFSITVTAQTTDASHRIYEVYACIGALTDEVRRDNYERYPIPRDYITFQQGGPLKVRLPDSFGAPGQLIIGANRPFPSFKATRMGTGAADADETDADELTVATGAIWKLYEARAAGDTNSPDWVRAETWRGKFETLVQKHLYMKTPERGGFEVFNAPLMGTMRMR